jgi:hypothetical protein
MRLARPDRREDALYRAGSPWENGYNESFNSKLRDELLNGEIFTTLREAQVLIERWRRHYNAVRPHSSLGYRPPAPETILPPVLDLSYAALRPDRTLADERRIRSWCHSAGQASGIEDLDLRANWRDS